ncbi:MAG TPA: hypothetical protein VMU33_01535 [Burkholderiaceae bacterium]|nr:hypothetical protein [Burkholderiaceae bacterium]
MFDTAPHQNHGTPAVADRRSAIDADRVDEFLRQHAPRPWKSFRGPVAASPAIDTAAAIYQTLLDPDLCASPPAAQQSLRAASISAIEPAVARAAPVEFFVDLGHGYRASLKPGREPLTFEVGLGEWFLLSQLARCAHRIAPAYAPGARFNLVVDNLFAWEVSAVALADTERYCAWLRALIAATGLDHLVRVVVESEQVAARDFAAAMESELAGRETAGSSTGGRQATTLSRRYAAAAAASHRLLAPFIDGPRLSLQPHSAALRLRPYPGGDGRIGAGETCLAQHDGRLRPVVLTRLSSGRYVRTRMMAPPALPDLIRAITIAHPHSTTH